MKIITRRDFFGPQQEPRWPPLGAGILGRLRQTTEEPHPNAEVLEAMAKSRRFAIHAG
jgi:hypothetical protein